MKNIALDGPVYQSVPGFEDHLKEELRYISVLNGGPDVSTRLEQWGPLLYLDTPLPAGAQLFWHLNTWFDPQKIEFESISEAAGALREIQRNWASVLFTQFRRGSLIASKLPPIVQKKRPFPWLLPEAPMGA